MQIIPEWNDALENLEMVRAYFERFMDLARRYRDDASLRARLDGGDTADALEALGIELPPDVAAKIVADTPETMHFVLPIDPNLKLADEVLNSIASGKTAGTIGTIGSSSSFACITSPSTLGTAGSGGTVGTTS